MTLRRATLHLAKLPIRGHDSSPLVHLCPSGLYVILIHRIKSLEDAHVQFVHSLNKPFSRSDVSRYYATSRRVMHV